MKNKKLFILLGGAAILLLAAVSYYTSEKAFKPAKPSINGQELLTVVTDFTKSLKQRWIWGDIEGLYAKDKLKCPEHVLYNTNVHKNYLACNPRYIQCFMTRGYGNKKYQVKLLGISSTNHIVMNFGIYSGNDLDSKYSFKLNFERRCHESLLPEQIYTLESLGKKTWSNEGRKIYVDKFLVNNNDIALWKNQEILDVISAGEPALGLSLQEQSSYCRSLGKNLLKAHLFEAAIRLPPSEKLSPYPWSLYSQKSSQGLVKQKISADLCRRSFLKECQKDFKWKSFDTDSVSWVGIHDVFGGPSERFINIFDPNKQYKMADWDTSMKSRQARIGFKEKALESQVGFRCYRENLKTEEVK